MNFKDLKKQLKPEFAKNYEKYYPVKSFGEIGFSRHVCKKCGQSFWSASVRDHCDKPSCSLGYRFVGSPITRKKFMYREAWEEYVKIFKTWGYVPIKRYPVVCRWYEELYFVNAGINDFQPYVVKGDVDPPADAVLEPQFCLRFQDMDSVGITGRHYTGFIMVGQHTFNTPKKYVYFKEEGIKQIHEFLTNGLGIPADEIFYHEDIWAGGGNFGPCIEFFSRGLELGNQVYIQYEMLPDGSSRELKTRVIDMGAGLERWSWFSQGLPMSYDTVFPEVMNYLHKKTGFTADKYFMNKFSRYSSLLDIDEIDDVNSVWNEVVKDTGISLRELKETVYKMRALYAIGDHTRSLLVGIHDGALPSNVGGGYNLRNLLRRCWSLIDEFNLSIELEDIFKIHIKEFGSWFTELNDVGSLFDIIETEKERYQETKEKGRKILKKMIESKEEFNVKKLVELYDSQGISPELVKEINPEIETPDNFYKLVEELHESQKKGVKEELKLPKEFPETRQLYYESSSSEFEATVIGIFENYVILDKTLFYPEGGGQEPDFGEINGINVIDVQKSGRVILHKLENISIIKEGSIVKGKIDYDRRKQLTQHHTATHIVNASAREVLGPHVWQAGAHKGVDISRLDITHFKSISDDELKRIEDRANEIVRKSIPIKIYIMKRNDAEKKYGFRLYQGGAVPGTELRVVEIPGIDAEACGGTHLNNTAEAGEIRIVGSKRIQDGVVRLEFKAGKATIKYLQERAEIARNIALTIEKNTKISTVIRQLIERQQKQMQELVEQLTKPYLLAHRVYELQQKQMQEFIDSIERIQLQIEEAAKIFSVPKEKLSETIERFIGEVDQMEKEIINLGGKSSSEIAIREESISGIVKTSEYIFERWKEDKKILDKLQSKLSKDLIDIVEEKFRNTDTIKHITSGRAVNALTEVANKAIEKQGRLIILLNGMGDKVNVVVASSSTHNAGDICKRLCEKLGGGGGGSPMLAIGGGKAKDAERILMEFRI